MNILGISCFYHDSAACLVKDGEIIAAVQEERFTRKKHDDSFPINAVDYCLKEGNITKEDLNLVVFYEKPVLKFARILENHLAFTPFGVKQFIDSLSLWLRKKIWIPDIIRKELGGFKGELIFTRHHEAHAASAFFPSPFEKALILVLDAVGEYSTSSIGIGDKNTIEIKEELNFPHSLGMLYSAFTYFTGFKVNSGEYKLMGLAPYGKPKYVDLIYNNLLDLKEDGSFRLNMDYFNYCTGFTMTNDKFSKLFGRGPRKSESELTEQDMDLAASIQVVTQDVVVRMAKYAKGKYGGENLCMAGGVALNCVANGKLLRSGLFKNIWVQPAAGDAGGALGAALLAWYGYLHNERTVSAEGRDSQRASLLGPSFSGKEIKQFLDKNSIAYREYADEETLLDAVSDFIAQNKVIGWFNGRMEFGPRALGSRSIIGDARSKEMQSIMNLKIKFRESFRPFAPSVLEERAGDFFECDRPSPYMLFTFDVVENKRKKVQDEGLFGIERLKMERSDIPAVTHLDYSARIQTVSQKDNGRYYKLIKKFYDKTGCPVIVNTSFNVRGEPIVCAPEDAYKCFMRTKMDFLVLENFVLDKNEQKNFKDEENWREKYQMD